MKYNYIVCLKNYEEKLLILKILLGIYRSLIKKLYFSQKGKGNTIL